MYIRAVDTPDVAILALPLTSGSPTPQLAALSEPQPPNRRQFLGDTTVCSNDIMSSATPSPDPTSIEHRGRGRAKSRGGLGKYLRARGRRGYGRPAEFNKRLLLDGEGPPSDDDEAEQTAANAIKYSRRQLASNADRYEEPEPELGSDGTCIPSSSDLMAIYLSSFMHAT